MEKKNQWASNIGFILATAGAAIGLGNLWKFPYLMGKNGGFQFLLLYLVFVIILGLPVMIAELSIGRMTGEGPVKAYTAMGKKGKLIGVLGISCAFIILSYYSVIGGWIIKYIISYVTTLKAPADFGAYIASPVEPVVWHIVFMAICCMVCLMGTRGIEKVSRFLMPALFILMLIIVVRSVTLPNAKEGIAFILSPEGNGFQISSIPAALGQVFYSLSLCMGITVTYGCYLNKKENIPKSTVTIAGLDTLIAVMAGFAIFPAVFSFGMEPAQGPSLTFGTLPAVFSELTGGSFFAIAFFGLMLFAAVTSAIALLECVVAAVLNALHWDRKKGVILTGAAIALLGIPSALSFGVLKDVSILNYSVFDFMGMLTDNIVMPLGGILMCVYLGWVWGPERIVEHVESSGIQFPFKRAWVACIKFVTPVLVLIVTIVGLISVIQTILS